MPRLSDTMEEGTILRWLKHDGEHVHRGEELVEIETDKAAMTYESDSEGSLQTLASEGDTLAVGEPIARVGGETVATHNGSPIAQNESVTPDAPDAKAVAAVEPDRPPADVEAGQSPSTELSSPPPSSERVKASPLARRIARETGVDLGGLTGSASSRPTCRARVRAPSLPRPRPRSSPPRFPHPPPPPHPPRFPHPPPSPHPPPTPRAPPSLRPPPTPHPPRPPRARPRRSALRSGMWRAPRARRP